MLHLCLRDRYASSRFQVSDSLLLTSRELLWKRFHIKSQANYCASTVTCSCDVFVSKCLVQTVLFPKRGSPCYSYKDPAEGVVRADACLGSSRDFS